MEAGAPPNPSPVQAKTTSLTTAADPRPVSAVVYIGGSALLYRVMPNASVAVGQASCSACAAPRSRSCITRMNGVLCGLPSPSGMAGIPLSLPILTNIRPAECAGVPYTP